MSAVGDRLTKEREAEIRADVEAGRWGAERPRTGPDMVRVWFGKDDTANGLEYSEWFEPALNPDRLVQLVRRAGMAADLLAELDATRDELREKDERISRQEASVAELRDERDGARAAVAQRWALRREVEAILGVPEGAASDEQLRLGVEAARRLVERAEAAEAQLAALRSAGRDAVDAFDDISVPGSECRARNEALRRAVDAARPTAEAYKRRVQAEALRRAAEDMDTRGNAFEEYHVDGGECFQLADHLRAEARCLEEWITREGE